MSARIALLRHQMDTAYERLAARLDGLTDEEYLWRPVPDVWTIRAGAGGG
jgi:predicted pyridoxine 5'-phosphate oxidase superfamily flavin-nucleotide-binding protein